MAIDHVASLLASVDVGQGLKVFIVGMLLAAAIGRLGAETPALRKVAQRKK